MNNLSLPVLILTAAVVCMQNQICFTKIIVAEEVVKEGNYAIPPLPDVLPLIYEVVDLFITNIMIIMIIVYL